MSKDYIHCWWFDSGHGPWLECRHGTRKHSASRMQATHKDNGWPVSRMKVIEVEPPSLPRKMKKKVRTK